MAFYVPTNLTNETAGMEQLIINESSQISILVPGILLFIWLGLAGAGYFSQERRIGRGNFFMWLAISGMITTTGSFILFLYNGMVNIDVVIIGMVLTIITAMAFLLTPNDF